VVFTRAADDGVFNTVVWNVVMKRLVQDLHDDSVLYAKVRVVGFYRLFDFAMDPDNSRGSHSCPQRCSACKAR
jgi:hypothetical protein